MLKHGCHVHYVKSLSALLGVDHVCTKCHMVYEAKHSCTVSEAPKKENPEHTTSYKTIKPESEKKQKKVVQTMVYNL